MRLRIWHVLIATALVALLFSAPCAAQAAPPRPPAAPVTYSITATDSATTNAIDLRVSLDAATAEVAALNARLSVVASQAAEQSATLDAAVRTYESAQNVFDARAVEMYQAGDYSLISILLDARSFSDLVARVELVTRVMEADGSALEELQIVAEQARFQAARLDSLRTEETALRTALSQRNLTVTTAQASLTAIQLQLTFQANSLLETVRQKNATYRQEWVLASVPATQPVATRSVKVLPYSANYLSSQFHYPRYRTTDIVFTATATWYGNAFDGCVTASGQTFNAADFTCAHATLPIGTWLAITRTDKTTAQLHRVIVVVNDRGPYVPNRDLQVSRAVADALGLTDVGVDTVSVEVVTPY